MQLSAPLLVLSADALRLQAHCDDLLLNLVVSDRTQLPPLRIALPPSSVNDYATVCRCVPLSPSPASVSCADAETDALARSPRSPLDRTLSSGLADQGSRSQLRTACMQHFLAGPHFSPDVSSPSSMEIAVCASRPRSLCSSSPSPSC